MSVLFVDQSGQLGGAELCLFDIVTRLIRPLQVCLFDNGPFALRLRDAGIKTAVLQVHPDVGGIAKNATFLSQLYAAPRLPPFLARFADIAKQADLIWANTQKAFVVSALVARFTRRPLIWHLHDMLTADHFSGSNRRLVIWLANRCANRVIANSQATADSFVAAGGHSDLVHVVPNGIDSSPFDAIGVDDAKQVRRTLGVTDAPLIGMFGRFAPWKGQEVAIEVLSSLPDAQLMLVGDALFGEVDCKMRLLSMIRDRNLSSRVHLLGFRDDVPALMNACDIIVHCSTAPEPFGRVIVEGMLAGRAVIASDAGGAAEIIQHGKTGVLVRPSDPAALTDAIRSLLDDIDYSQRLAEAGRAHALKTYNLDAVVRLVESHIAAVLDGSHGEASALTA